MLGTNFDLGSFGKTSGRSDVSLGAEGGGVS